MTMWMWKVLSIILFIIAAFFILTGIGAMVLLPSPDSTIYTAALTFFIFGALFIISGIKAFRLGSANSEGLMRKWKALSVVSFALGVPFILLGIPASLSSAKGGTVIIGIGAFLIVLGVIAYRKDLAIAKGMTLLAEGRGLTSPRYFIGNEGIYKENKLFLRWSEIVNIFVIHEYEITKSNLSVRTLQAGVPSMSGTIYIMGTFRVITKDGREIDIKNVINPKEILEYIKNTYLKNIS
jgi:hypothetical protein